MRKCDGKRVLFVWFVGVLAACGPRPETLPPELNNTTVGVISPYDTVWLDFTEKVREITAAQVHSDLPVSVRKKGSNWGVIGDSIVAGLPLFRPGSAYEVRLSRLESEEGELQSRDQVLTFRTMLILDSDFSRDSSGNYRDNNTRANADRLADSMRFFNGASLDSGISVAGLLAGTAHAVADDDQDWYALDLRYQDSLWIELKEMTQNLNLEFRGPVDKNGVIYPEVKASAKTGTADEQIGVFIDGNRAAFGTTGGKSVDSPLTYYIGIKHGVSGDSRPASPYVLSVKKILRVR